MFATTHSSSKIAQPAALSGHHRMTDLKSGAAIRADREMRHDRWLAIGVFLLFVGLIACILTLAFMSGGSMSLDNGYEYWMP